MHCTLAARARLWAQPAPVGGPQVDAYGCHAGQGQAASAARRAGCLRARAPRRTLLSHIRHAGGSRPAPGGQTGPGRRSVAPPSGMAAQRRVRCWGAGQAAGAGAGGFASVGRVGAAPRRTRHRQGAPRRRPLPRPRARCATKCCAPQHDRCCWGAAVQPTRRFVADRQLDARLLARLPLAAQRKRGGARGCRPVGGGQLPPGVTPGTCLPLAPPQHDTPAPSAAHGQPPALSRDPVRRARTGTAAGSHCSSRNPCQPWRA